MSDCGFCGGPRINGASIRKTDEGWSFATADDIHSILACRSCAKEKIEA